jgi:MoaA/NifB/PqqE/SkfB family radical SAM enzyme
MSQPPSSRGTQPNPRRIAASELRAIRERVQADVVRVTQAHIDETSEAEATANAMVGVLCSGEGGEFPPKGVDVNGNVYFHPSIPGWPGARFERFLVSEVLRARGANNGFLQSANLEVTKQCPLRCEHCSAWSILGKPETLTTDDWRAIVAALQADGVGQLVLSGGEPAAALGHTCEIVRSAAGASDCWVATSGWGLDARGIDSLAAAGLTGIQVSVDHWDGAAHDWFRRRRGSFDRALATAAHARSVGLVVCVNTCVRPEFSAADDLVRHARLAGEMGATFVQWLEARAVGHYEGADVALNASQITAIETVYAKLRGDLDEPIVSWPERATRMVGCAGGGRRHLFVDADGFLHACPFCRVPGGHVLRDGLRAARERLGGPTCESPRLFASKRP